MSDVFNLRKIQELIKDKKPNAIILADTNLIMTEPDFSNWHTSCGEVLFVLSDVVILELHNLKNKRKKDDRTEFETYTAAQKASRSICELYSSGYITDGIHVKSVGWFISVPSPKESEIGCELKERDSIVKAFGTADAKFLLLAKQIFETIPNTPTVFATADKLLFSIISSNGIPAYIFKGFPIADLNRYTVRKPALKAVDWNEILANVQKTIETKSVEVALTLTSKRTIPKWLWITTNHSSDSSLLVAEGHGVINFGKGIGFSWSLPYSEWDYPFLRPEQADQLYPKPRFLSKTAYLDFSGHDNDIPAKVTKKLAEIMTLCSFPWAHTVGFPTILNPVSVIKYFFHVTYFVEKLYEKASTDDEIALEFAEAYIEAPSFEDFGIKIFARLACNLDDEDRTSEALYQLFTALKNCWNVGESRTIRIDL
jgi:hypothetical protein